MSKASAHYVIDRDGSVVQMVMDENRAWHAGVSSLNGIKNVNDFSIGIELVNWGIIQKKDNKYYAWPKNYNRIYDEKELGIPIEIDNVLWAPYPDIQIKSCIDLCGELRIKYPDITSDRIVGHMHIAPSRKQDPGPLFPFDRARKESSPILEIDYCDIRQDERNG